MKVNVDLIIQAEYVVPMDATLTVIRDGAVVCEDGNIVAVGPADVIKSKYKARTVFGGKGRALIPGLVNTHTHAPMVYFRGLADDLPLKEWLEKHIWPAETQWLSPEFVSDAVELACLEMLKAGITTYHDMYFFGDAAGISTKRMGMRAVLGVGILDFPSVSARTQDEYFEKAEDFIQRWRSDDLICTSIAPHSLYACRPETLVRARQLAEKCDIPIHVHLAETQWEVEEIRSRYGKTPVRHLEALDFLDGKVLAAHCIWVDDEEIGILAKKGVGVSHCIESNLKLASGIAPVARMLKAGVKVTFGTDGAASNNDLNILSEMSTAAKVHKAVSSDPTALDARTVLLMATRWGAEALGLGGTTGSIGVGKAADLVLLNLETPHLTPIYDIYSHLVYSVQASDVDTVIVGGKVLVEDGHLITDDEGEILAKARAWGERIRGGKERGPEAGH